MALFFQINLLLTLTDRYHLEINLEKLVDQLDGIWQKRITTTGV